MQTSEKMIASRTTASQSEALAAADAEHREHEVEQRDREHAEQGGDQHSGELRRHPDGAGLVDDEHADEHADGAEDRLRNHPGATGGDEVGDQERRRAEEQALERGVAQHDRRVVLLATERRDQDQRRTHRAPPTSTNGIIKPGFIDTRKYDTMPTTVTTPSVMPVLVTTSSMVSGRVTPACC